MTGYQFHWAVLLEYRQLLLRGLVVTLQVSLVVLVLSCCLGLAVAVGRTSRQRWLRALSGSYVEAFRNVPPLVQIFFWYFGVGLDSFMASVVALSLYSSVYVGETVRSGIQAIPKAQHDAALSTGLTRWRVLRHIVLPQATMIVIPPLGTEFINIVKNSSLAMAVGVGELTFQTQEIDAITFRGFEAATAVTGIYLALALIIVAILTVVERILNVGTKVL